MKTICLILTLFLTSSIVAQSSQIDSLKIIVESSDTDSIRFKALLDLIYEISFYDEKESLNYSNQALTLARQMSNPARVLDALWYKTNYEIRNRNYNEALPFAEEMEQLAIEVNVPYDHGAALNFQKQIYYALHDYKKAIKFSDEYLALSLEEGDSLMISRSFLGIGVLYSQLDKDSLAIDYYKKAIPYFTGRNRQRGLLSTYLNLGESYKSINAHDSAAYYLEKGLPGAIASGEVRLIEKYYLNLATNENSWGRYEKSNIYAYRSIDYWPTNKKEFGKELTYNVLGSNYFNLNMIDSSLNYLTLSYNIISQKRNKYGIESILENLTELHIQIGDYEQAYTYTNELYQHVDSLYNEEINEEIANSRTKYEVLEKEKLLAEKELEVLRSKTQRNILVLGGIGGLILLGSWVLLFTQRQKQKKKEAEQELKLERERADNLKQLDDLKDQFFTNISHELRTPLTLINDPLERALKSENLNQERELIDLANKNSHQLLSLVNEIMDLSKLESGKFVLNLKSIDIIKECKRIFYAFDSFADMRQVSLKFNSEIESPFVIKTDPNHLEKILNNLISNAIKFTRANTEITFNLGLIQNNLQLSIADKGNGIEASEIDRIFDRFYQSQQNNELKGGTGVGLALSKALAENLNGTLTVESTQNVGSVFKFEFPIIEKGGEADSINEEIIESTESNTYQPLLLNGEKPDVLIIEDNEDMQVYLKKILSDYYNCKLASNGIEGLKKLQTEKVDMVISDIMMPGMSGFELRQRVNDHLNLNRLPYIFLSARSLEDDIIKGLRLGVDDYMTKPFRSEELIVRTQNLIKNKIERDRLSSEDNVESLIFSESEDDRFLKEVENLVYSKMTNSQLKISEIAAELNMSQKQFGRRLKKLTGLSPVAFVLELRLLKAKQLLDRRIHNNLSDVRFDVGIESASYFSSKFKERFGFSPNTLLEK